MEEFCILEFGNYLAAPLAGKFLRAFGCRVVSVARPLHSRGAHEEAAYCKECAHDLHFGKERVPLTLPAQRAEAERLVREADVLVENFGPGVMERLGVGRAACRVLNPKLIYVSMPAYTAGDGHAATCAWDSVVMATSGVFTDMGLNRTLRGIAASYSPLPLASVYGAVYATMAIAAALYGEERGIDIEVPLAGALSEALVHNSLRFPLDESYMSRRARRIAQGTYPIDAVELEGLLDPFFAQYVCADGRRIYLVCPAHAGHQLAALRVLGIDAGALPIVDPYDAARVYGIGAAHLSTTQARAVRPLLEAAFRGHGATEWERRLTEAGVPASAVRTAGEWRAYARSAGLLRPDAMGECIPSIGWLEAPAPTPPVAAPPPSASSPASSAASSPASSAASSPASSPAPLAGITIVDMSNVIAGPTIGAYCARMGARVIKVDPPRPTYAPTVSVVYGLAANAGKESVLLDALHPAGRHALEALLRTADVLLVNATSAALVRLRLSRDHLHALNPRLILVRFDAWGAPGALGGNLLHANGYDDNVQAAIGIMARFGGSLDTAEEHAHVGTIDVIAGVAGAATTVVALLRRRRHGIVCTARSSLVVVGQHVQYPFMFGEHACVGRGVECRGIHALHRCVRCRDAWIIVAAPPTESAVAAYWPRIRHALGLDARATPSALDAVAPSLDETGIRTGLAGIPGVGVARLRCMHTLCTAYTAPSRQAGDTYWFYHDATHPIGPLCIIGDVAIRTAANPRPPARAPRYGEHTVAVLTEFGPSDVLLRGGGATGWSKSYMPFAAACHGCGARGRAGVGLVCGHTVCHTCCARDRARAMCPVCLLPHELSVPHLRARSAAHRSAYRAWRSGGARGATDMHRITSTPALPCVPP